MRAPPTKVLVATRHSPFPENDGAGAYLFDFLSYLAENGCRIEVAWLEAEGTITRRGHWQIPRHFSKVARLHIITGHTVGRRIFFPLIFWLPFKANVQHAIKSTLARVGLWRRKPQPASKNFFPPTNAARAAGIWSAQPSPAEKIFFEQRLATFRPDCVIANYCWLAPLLENLPASITRVLQTNDIASQRVPATLGLARDPGTVEGEAALLRLAHHVLAISEEDAAFFRSCLPPAHSVILMPKAARATPLSGTTDPLRVLFVGGMNEFNREGMHWFLETVWPAVKAAQPNATLRLCGAISTTVTNPPPGVTIMGRVPDLTSEYAAASVVIVPLLRGSGVKIKLVEAAGYGKAIVTTPVGLQGLAFLRSSVLECDSSAAFADGVTRLLGDAALRRRLGETTLSAVTAHLSRDNAYGAAARALRRAA